MATVKKKIHISFQLIKEGFSLPLFTERRSRLALVSDLSAKIQDEAVSRKYN